MDYDKMRLQIEALRDGLNEMFLRLDELEDIIDVEENTPRDDEDEEDE